MLVNIECPNCKFAGDVNDDMSIARVIASVIAIIGIIVLILLVLANALKLLLLWWFYLAIIIGVALAVSNSRLRCPKCNFKYITKKVIDK